MRADPPDSGARRGPERLVDEWRDRAPYDPPVSSNQSEATPTKLSPHAYEKNLARLQRELVKLQEWVRHEGLKVCVLFEGRDAAGKGGTIKRIVERTNPRVVRVAALGTPTEKEQTQWYFQRYVDAPAGRRRDRALRPVLVQPRGRRARHGLLQ